MPTAAVIVIGDEILSAKVRDENSPWLAKQLRQMGIDLRRIVTVPDVIEVIADEVRRCRNQFDHVLTTGGVGPTHDDLTLAGVARAFDLGLERHPKLVALIDKHIDHPDDDAYRMAEIPVGSHLWWEDDDRFPLVVVDNVYIFPGVPGLLRKKFEAARGRFATAAPMVSGSLEVEKRETDIAGVLREVQAAHPEVAIGSYPQYDKQPWTVTLTVDSRDAGAVEAVLAILRERIG